MNIKNNTVIKTQYITSDNTIFTNLEDARDHEYNLIRCKLYDSSFSVFEYNVYTITCQDEIDAIKNDIFKETTFNLPNDLKFPFFLCESTFDDYYYFYNTLDSVIKAEEEKLEILKGIKFKEA